MASPAHDARALALHVLGLRRPSELLGVTEIDEIAYGELVTLRGRRIPLQHLVGSVGFRYLELLVGPGVFVPRPETELVAEAAIRAAGRDAIVVDLCTGSGAIALSVAHEVLGATVHAVELDPTALGWARRNAEVLGLAVSFTEGPVRGALATLDGVVDVVVSNPPYVPVGTAVDVETGHDPALALWGGVDGLDIVREVETAARRLLRRGGTLVVEHDVTHGEVVPALLEAAGGWVAVTDHADLTGRPRFVTARWQM